VIGKARPVVESGATKGAMYKLVVRGELDSRFAYLFNEMEMQRVQGTTVLTGKVIDQAQLHGFIERIEELGLELLAVERLGEPT
jgi:cell division FtsZ-interacting protein ZapD